MRVTRNTIGERAMRVISSTSRKSFSEAWSHKRNGAPRVIQSARNRIGGNMLASELIPNCWRNREPRQKNGTLAMLSESPKNEPSGADRERVRNAGNRRSRAVDADSVPRSAARLTRHQTRRPQLASANAPFAGRSFLLSAQAARHALRNVANCEIACSPPSAKDHRRNLSCNQLARTCSPANKPLSTDGFLADNVVSLSSPARRG